MKKSLNESLPVFHHSIWNFMDFTTKYYFNPTKFKIIILDNNNHQRKNNHVRTVFKTREVAHSYVEEYQKTFPEHSFLLKDSELQINKRWIRS